MDLQKEFEKEKGYDCFAYRQDYAGANQYKDGFNDDYVEWLESKVNNVVSDDVIKCNHDFKPTTMHGEFYGNKCIHCGEYEDLT